MPMDKKSGNIENMYLLSKAEVDNTDEDTNMEGEAEILLKEFEENGCRRQQM